MYMLLLGEQIARKHECLLSKFIVERVSTRYSYLFTGEVYPVYVRRFVLR